MNIICTLLGIWCSQQLTSNPYAFTIPLDYLGCITFPLPDGDRTLYGWKFEQPVAIDLGEFVGTLRIVGDIEFSGALDVSVFCTDRSKPPTGATRKYINWSPTP
jgi:hypothetical protein